jgi:carbon-monoxide dehydrogenase large subunit
MPESMTKNSHRREDERLLTGRGCYTADWMRGIRCGEHAVPTKSNALGAKGVGASGTSGALPAIMNAMLCALRPAGVRELDMPATPDRVWRALRAARPVVAAPDQ